MPPLVDALVHPARHTEGKTLINIWVEWCVDKLKPVLRKLVAETPQLGEAIGWEEDEADDETEKGVTPALVILPPTELPLILPPPIALLLPLPSMLGVPRRTSKLARCLRRSDTSVCSLATYSSIA